MTFNKQEYWKDREDGLRGQGDEIRPTFKPGKQGEHMVRIGGKVTMVNRKQARQKIVNRDYTKPNVEYRRKKAHTL